MYRKTAVVLGALIVCGCEVAEPEEASPSPLVGTWVTDACAQMSDPDGAPLEQWAQGLYSFYESGALALRFNEYADPACVLPTSIVEDFDEPEFTPLTYRDLGEETLPEGLPGGKVVINAQIGGDAYEFSGYYTIDNGSLCLSDRLNLDPLSLSSTEDEGMEIDFEKCLTRGK